MVVVGVVSISVAWKSLKAATSLSFSTMIANTYKYRIMHSFIHYVSILTFPNGRSLVPAGTIIFARYPVLGVSISITALSVST